MNKIQNPKNRITIYDTTLRDSTQSEGISFSVEDKIRIAKRLDEFGVDYIEGGWPGSNPKDMIFFQQASELSWKRTKIAAFGSTRRAKNRVEDDDNIQTLLNAQIPVVTIFGKTWDLHVKDALNISPSENLKLIGDSLIFLKSQGRGAIYDAEHFFDGLDPTRNMPSEPCKPQPRLGPRPSFCVIPMEVP